MTFNFLQNRINAVLQECLPPAEKTPERLHQAMRYAVFNGGKRIRPLLVYATGLCFNMDLAYLDRPAAAIELMHCYSLVHDDLPAMDNDDYRRGQLSCHKAFDEATAILVGDALQSLAFAIISQPSELYAADIQIRMVQTLANTSGSLGMAGGQQLDLQHQNQTVTRELLHQINLLKTGALFQASVELGAIASNSVDDDTLNSLQQFAHLIGVAFQTQDDVFDADAKWLAKDAANPLFSEAMRYLEKLPSNGKPLRDYCELLQTRTS